MLLALTSCSGVTASPTRAFSSATASGHTAPATDPLVALPFRGPTTPKRYTLLADARDRSGTVDLGSFSVTGDLVVELTCRGTSPIDVGGLTVHRGCGNEITTTRIAGFDHEQVHLRVVTDAGTRWSIWVALLAP